jgi:hypothetical protein
MAEVDTFLLSSQHNDIRKEAVDHTNETIKEGLKGDYATLGAIKDTRHDISDLIGSNSDRLEQGITVHNTAMQDRMFTVARDTADLKALVGQTLYAVDAAADRTAKESQIAVLQNTIEGQKNTAYLSDKIGVEGDRTRALLNELQTQDLNRKLIERNTEIIEERAEGRHWRGRFDQGQFANLQNQIQNFGSQIAETRQGMTNFGTQLGVGQTSTSNNA